MQTTSRSLHLRASTVEECDVWCAKINAMMRTSVFCEAHVHSSFAPMRDVAMCSALINGDDYYRAILTALNMAASEIFIAGWWVNLDVKLTRGEGEREVRVCKERQTGEREASLLTTQALSRSQVTLRDALTDATCKRGVKVYVMLYKEQAVAMPNNR